MGTSLSGLTPATTFDGLLKTSDNEPLDGTLKTISDGSGVDSVLQLSDSALQVNGQATIVGAGNDATTTALLVQNSDGTALLDIDDNGTINIGRGNGKIISSPGGLVSVPGFAFSHTGAGLATFDNGGVNIIGSGATSATTSLLVQNSAGTENFRIYDDGNIVINNKIGFSAYSANINSSFGLSISTISSTRPVRVNGSSGLYVGAANGVDTPAGSILAEGDVGIGETTPTARLHIKGSGNDNTTTSLLVQNSDSTGYLNFRDDGLLQSKVTSTSSSKTAFQLLDLNGATLFRVFANGKGNIAGDFGVGTDAPTARHHIKGSGATSATTALLVQNSAGTELLKVRDDGAVSMEASNLSVKNSALLGYGTNRSVGIGTGSTRVGVSLEVKGKGNDATTTALLVTNLAGTELLKVADNGQISASGSNLTIGDGADVTLRLLASGSAAAGNSYIQPLGTPANQRVIVTGNSVATIKAVDLDASNVYIGHGINQTAATGTLSIKGSGATSATTALLVQNSAGTELLKVRDDGVVQLNSNSVFSDTGTSLKISTNGNTRMQITNSSIHPWGGENLGVSNTLNFHYGNIYSKGVTHITDNTTSSTTLESTAKLQVDSTTQGFLPPRMTTTERDAITTPAAGLMVYNTTTNKAQCYNGTTWNDLF